MSTRLRHSAVPLEGSTNNSVLLLRSAPKSQPHFASTAKRGVWAPSGTFGARGEHWQVLVWGEPAVPSRSWPAREHISTVRQEGIQTDSHLCTRKYKQPRRFWKLLYPKAGAVQHPQLAENSVHTGGNEYVWIRCLANGEAKYEIDWNPCVLLKRSKNICKSTSIQLMHSYYLIASFTYMHTQIQHVYLSICGIFIKTNPYSNLWCCSFSNKLFSKIVFFDLTPFYSSSSAGSKITLSSLYADTSRKKVLTKLSSE